MKRAIVVVGAFFLIGSAGAAALLQPDQPKAQSQLVDTQRIEVDHPQADWTGVGGPEEDEQVAAAPRRPVRTAEQMRAGSAWAQHGGLSGSSYQGVGGPEEDEERLYPPCRSRGEDRCQQRR